MSSQEHDLLTQEQIDATDDMCDNANIVLSLPAARGSDLRALASLPVFVVHGVSTGAMSLGIDGWDS